MSFLIVTMALIQPPETKTFTFWHIYLLYLLAVALVNDSDLMVLFYKNANQSDM